MFEKKTNTDFVTKHMGTVYIHAFDFLLQGLILSMTVSELEKSMMEHETTRNGAWPVRPGHPIHRTHLVLVR